MTGLLSPRSRIRSISSSRTHGDAMRLTESADIPNQHQSVGYTTKKNEGRLEVSAKRQTDQCRGTACRSLLKTTNIPP